MIKLIGILNNYKIWRDAGYGMWLSLKVAWWKRNAT